MPIYAYKCDSCGHAKDILQKISDQVLTDCPACGKATFKKQVTAAGFQLKGSGWYVTDFRGGSTGSESNTTVAPASSSADSASPAPAASAAPAATAKADPAPAPAPSTSSTAS